MGIHSLLEFERAFRRYGVFSHAPIWEYKGHIYSESNPRDLSFEPRLNNAAMLGFV